MICVMLATASFGNVNQSNKVVSQKLLNVCFRGWCSNVRARNSAWREYISAKTDIAGK